MKSKINSNCYPLRLSALVLALSVAGLSACTSILPEPKPAPAIYRLSVPEMTGNVHSSGPVVNIMMPTAPHVLGGTDIILSPDGRRLTSAAGARWAEPVPEQLRHVLLDALAQDGQVLGVIPQGGTNAQFWLNMDIRAFEADFDQGEDQPPLAVVQLVLNMTETGSRKLLGTKNIRATARADERRVSSIVEAQDVATRKAMQDAVSWIKSMTGAHEKS